MNIKVQYTYKLYRRFDIVERKGSKIFNVVYRSLQECRDLNGLFKIYIKLQLILKGKMISNVKILDITCES